MNVQRPKRRSVRLDGYDYTDQGPYFVTICTHNRVSLFGEVIDMEMSLTSVGNLVHNEWIRSDLLRPGLLLDAFVVMPNHIHGIVTFQNPVEPVDLVGAHSRAPATPPNVIRTRQPRSLGSFIAGFKSVTTKQINAQRGTPGTPVWQRNYFEHIIRSDRALDRIRHYIYTNPQRWPSDPENPANR